MRPRSCAAAVLACVSLVASAQAASAKTYEVTRTNDPVPGACSPGDCSLREAVLAANGSEGLADKIVLPNRKKPYKLIRPGTGENGGIDGDLDLTSSRIVIVHPGRGRATIDASAAGERVFEALAPLVLRKLVLTGGTDSDDGGAIQATANVRILNSVLRGNEAGNVGGAIDMDEEGTLRVVRSVLRGNEAANTAGAIRDGSGAITILRSKLIGNRAENDGGAIRFSSASGTIVRSTISRNRTAAGSGGAIQSDLEGPLRIKKSTFASNRAGDDGGGVYAVGLEQLRISSSTLSGNRTASDGGGIYLDGPPASIANSTLTGNRANALGGGIHAQDGADLTLNAVTVVRNRAGADDPGPVLLVTGGGLSRISSVGFDVRNSLIALNTIGAGGLGANDCAGDTALDSLGNNLLSTLSGCDGFEEPTDLVRNNPKIRKLRSNGGPTKTVALKRGSAAIGHAHKPSAPGRDQRGRKRDNDPDTGAFERGA